MNGDKSEKHCYVNNDGGLDKDSSKTVDGFETNRFSFFKS